MGSPRADSPHRLSALPANTCELWLAGAGGFINISQNARAVYFLGTFASRSRVEIQNGNLRIIEPGTSKLVERVGQVTFSGEYARRRGQTVYYITERCVFKLIEGGLEIVEIVPGVVLGRDILSQMAFRPVIPDTVGHRRGGVGTPPPPTSCLHPYGPGLHRRGVGTPPSGVAPV